MTDQNVTIGRKREIEIDTSIYSRNGPLNDPGLTTWRLLHLETHGLTVTLLFTTTTTTTNQKIKTTGRSPLPTNSSLQTLKLQPHASPHLGTDLRIAQLSNIGSFDHHLSTTDRAFATNAGTQN
ncbi:hypothetical protein V1477_011058 [Vespula maculifrons]|uniref:Uncharacterized protein n=1 Tax=Vespula maculifrons TaxID=7453 RepID=A0ABD2C3U0_VESMC